MKGALAGRAARRSARALLSLAPRRRMRLVMDDTFRLGFRRGIDGRAELGPFDLPSHQLLTHGVIVGMTGSGKTGLVTVLVEEALRTGVPVLVIDVKGDLPNLGLASPLLRGARHDAVDRSGARRSATASRTGRWSERRSRPDAKACAKRPSAKRSLPTMSRAPTSAWSRRGPMPASRFICCRRSSVARRGGTPTSTVRAPR
jgi:hypothetical protein